VEGPMNNDNEENQLSDLSLLENRFFSLTDLFLEKNIRIDCEFKSKEDNHSSKKKKLLKWVNDRKNINDCDSNMRKICSEFLVELDVNNRQGIGYELDEYSVHKKIDNLDRETNLIYQEVLKEANQVRNIRNKIEEQERKRKEQEELEIRKAQYKEDQAKLKQELEIRRLREEEQNVQAAQAKKKENMFSIGSIFVGFVITLVGGLYSSNQYHLALSSMELLTHFAFSLFFGLSFSGWIYRDKLFNNTGLGYKNTLYMHSLGIPIIGSIVLYLAVANNIYNLMLLAEICIVACLFRYWYENINQFVFIKKYSYERILIFGGVFLVIGMFRENIIQMLSYLFAIVVVIIFLGFALGSSKK